MSIEQLKNALPDFAKDIRLNLGTVLTEAGSPGLLQKQIDGIALASAYAARDAAVVSALSAYAAASLSAEEMNAMKAAATIMAMNNIYYRFTHVMDDPAYKTMPARLRMNIMTNPGIDKILFELASLAVSAINGCGMCMNAHAAQIEKNGLSKEGVQSAVRIASVIHAAAAARSL